MLEVHTSDGSRIRVCLANFDFSGLGERKRPSSLLNLKRVVHELVEASPGVIQDDHFRFLPVEPDPGAGLLGLASTNEAQFDRYARTLAVHRRKLAIGDAISQRRTNR